MKAAAKDADVCRELFFDDSTPLDAVAAYLPKLEADSRVGLDVKHFLANLPSAAAAADGRAAWLDRAPPALVLGASRDGVVDREAVDETATFLGRDGEAELFDLPHDVMLCTGWEAPADRIIEWCRRL